MATPVDEEFHTRDERDLAREMRRVGIPHKQTRAIMDALLIWRISDLPKLDCNRLKNVAPEHWQALIDLRNRHVDGHVTHLYICAGM